MKKGVKKLKVSLLIPYVRPKKVVCCIVSAVHNAGIPNENIEVIAREDKDLIGTPKMVANLSAVADGEYMAFLGDDCIPQENWIKYALEDMQKFKDGWGLVGLSDGTNRNLPCHWLAHRKMLECLDNEFFHTGYKHCYCDNELRDRSIEAGRFCMSTKAVVEHNHPALNSNVPVDSFYLKAYKAEALQRDKELYLTRKANNWKG